MAFSLGSVFIEVGARNDRLRRDFSQTQKIMNGFKASVLSFAGPLTAALSIGALGADAYRTITNFEQAVADLGSIAGKSSREMSKLTESAIKIGAESSFTATQVVQLQTELAKLGFNESEILNSTKAIGDFSVAVGTDAASAAALGGAALRSFGLDASQAESVMNTLAIATTKSALDFSKLQTALPYVGTAANQMGVSLEKTTAILGLLSDRGVRAETAGTSLRDILLDSAKSGLTFEQSLARVANSQDKLKTATDIFGKTSAGAAVIIAENTNQLNRLQSSITNVDGALKTMTDQRLDTVKGKVELMTSAWEGFILSVDKGDGVFSRFAKSALGTLTDFIDDLQVINDKGLAGLQEKGKANLKASVKQDQLDKLGAATGQRSVRGTGYGKSFQDELKGATTVLDNLKEQLGKTNKDSAEFKQIQADIATSQKRVNDLTGKYTGIIDNNTKSTTKNTSATTAKIKELKKEIPPFVIKGNLEFGIDDLRTETARKLAEIDANIALGLETDGATAKIGVFNAALSQAVTIDPNLTDPFFADLQAKVKEINAIKPPSFVIKGSLDFEESDIFTKLAKDLAEIDLKAQVGLELDVKDAKFSSIQSALAQLTTGGEVTASALAKINEELAKIGVNPGIDKMATAANKMVESFQKANAVIAPANDLLTQLFSNQSAALDQKSEKEKLAIENSTMSEEAKASALLALDKKTAAERSKIAKKQALQNKVLGVFNATVSMFEGVAKAIALGPAGLPLIPLIKALGIANIAAVASAPLPSLAIGTDYVKKDGLAVLHKGEKVVPADVVKGGYTRDKNNTAPARPDVVLRNGDLRIVTEYNIMYDKRIRG